MNSCATRNQVKADSASYADLRSLIERRFDYRLDEKQT